LAAAAAHVAVVAVGPDWEISSTALDDELAPDEMAWIFLFAPPSSGTGASPGAAPVVLVADSTAEASDVGEGADGEQLTMEEYAVAIRQRLLRRGAPVPTLAEPEPEPEPVQSLASEGPLDMDGEGEESISIGGDASTADLSRLRTGISMDLARLAALRPDIVLAGAAAWVLVLNAPLHA
jgi:hypothetical protein